LPLWLITLRDRLRASFFFLPMVAVVVGAACATALMTVDDSIDHVAQDLPLVLGSTVDSARSVLSTIAAATISFSGIAFSVSLLVIQLSASQHSPRVVHTLFRDPFNKRVMALVLGTFTYCLVLLRAVRGPLEDSGDAVVPNLSLACAVLLGVLAILATIAFINHSAHLMDISVVLERVTDSAVRQVERIRSTPSEHGGELDTAVRQEHEFAARTTHRIDDAGRTADWDRSGWVQAIDLDRLAGLAPADGAIVLLTRAGRYAVKGTPFCRVAGKVDDWDRLLGAVRKTAAVGNSRTMQQDLSYGLRQLSDVALRALSPSVNDPTTAQDAIFHQAAVLLEILRRDPPPAVRVNDDGGRLVLAEEPTDGDYIRTAFAEIRRSAATNPAVCLYLLEALHLVHSGLHSAGLGERASGLEIEARLLLEGALRSIELESDREDVQAAHRERFGTAAPR